VTAVRRGVQLLGELCITAGVLVLLFAAWQLWWTDVDAGREQQAAARSLQEAWSRETTSTTPPGPVQTPEPGRKPSAQPGSQPSTAPGSSEPGPSEPSPSEPGRTESRNAAPAYERVSGEAFALIRVPRFGSDYVRPVVKGTDLSVLDEGVGHYEGTAAPGEVGNFALAGHRVTYAKPFGQIAELRRDDPVVIETRDTWYVYRVLRHLIVRPDQVDVVAPVPQQRGATPTKRLLTMTACHPRYSAEQRYVVIAELAQSVPKTGRAPSVLAAAGAR